ncbi:MAG TPA: class I SAM-dependent methyltransferase [Gammaproteobacteria bacterium]
MEVLLNRRDNPDASAARALFRLGSWLQDSGYRFVTVTPATHARMLSRASASKTHSFQDIFGWNKPFRPESLPQSALNLLKTADAVTTYGRLLRSKIRFSTIGDSIYLHSGYPTLEAEAVFFGPDTYRFAALIERTIAALEFRHAGCIVDIGCGTGAGGLIAAKLLRHYSPTLVLSDINPAALAYAEINALLAATPRVSFRQSDLFASVNEPADLIVANPPYLLDAKNRIYRHGGGRLGSGLSLRILNEALPRLAPGGALVLYTGAPVVAGKDIFLEALQPVLDRPGLNYEYRELDPDVFGEELENPVYAGVERIAAVSLVVHITTAAGFAARSEENAALIQPSAAIP